MKKQKYAAIVGILVALAVIGMVFAACEGPMGPQGIQGKEGEKGEKGADGEIGPQGPKGDPGISINWRGEFPQATDVPDAQKDDVYFNTTVGIAYIYDGEEWQRLSERGADGISIVWKGTRTTAPADPQLNWAYYNSTERVSYIWDGEEWQILVKDGEIGSQGPKGDPGADGEIGPQGPKGDPGAGGEFILVTGVSLNKTIINLDPGETFTLAATVVPEKAFIKAVTWDSSDPAVATVTVLGGKVTAVFPGTAIITVTTVEGNITAECTVNVNPFIITNTAQWNQAISLLDGKTGPFTFTINDGGAGIGLPGRTTDSFGTTADGKDLSLTLKGSGKLHLTSNGSLLRIGARQTLIIDSEALELAGLKSNNQPLVYVGADGTFTMNGGKISGNAADTGGGVYVNTSGTFTMHGGEISGNTADSGGGVSVDAGTFTMHDGKISGNTADMGGGGVMVYNEGTFRMVTGTIYGNEDTVDASLRNTAGTNGAALYVYSGTATYGPSGTENDLTTTNDTIKVEDEKRE